MKLTAEQQRKAEENMGLVGKVIADKVHGTYFGSYTREDLEACHPWKIIQELPADPQELAAALA